MSIEQDIFFEKEGIDPDRIITDEYQVAKELLCTICQGLLWKAKSCDSCQHLFCDRCIRTWLQINPTSCPFRCSPYKEKRPPPHIHSLLARLSIRCRNSTFGCTAILSYDALEQHETSECQFLTKRCRVCKENILIDAINEHQRYCKPTTIICPFCKQSIDRILFTIHIGECLQQKVDVFLQEILALADRTEIPLNDTMMFVPQQQINNNWLERFNNRLQEFAFRLPQINLRGFEETVQAQQQNNWAQFWSIAKLIWLNPSRTVQIILPLICFGFGYFVGFLIATSIFIQKQVNSSIYRSFPFIILVSGVICFGLPNLLASVNDMWIITLTIISALLFSATSLNMPLAYMKVYQSTILILFFYIIGLVGFEVSLLLLRLFVWYIPPYISATCLAWSIIFVTFHLRRV